MVDTTLIKTSLNDFSSPESEIREGKAKSLQKKSFRVETRADEEE